MKQNSSFAIALGVLVALIVIGHGDASVLRPRYNNPPDRVKDWVALGDSFAAGPGAGEEYDHGGSGHCMRRKEAYAPQLQNDDTMIGPDGPGSRKPTFQFAACSGDTTANLLDFSKPEENQLNKIRSDTTFATLSIGGNDVFFGAIDARTKGTEAMYSKEFHDRYFTVLDQIIQEKFRWSPQTHDTSVLYQTGYTQFFDDYTTQCDETKFFPAPNVPLITQELRRNFNLLTHSLNEVLQYWIDLRNVKLAKFLDKPGDMRMYVSPIHFIDLDWRYMNHRFCTDGVKEPARKNVDTWFFHAPLNPLIPGQENNETYLEEVMKLYPLTWQPGRPGEPEFDASGTGDSEDTPFDPNNPAHLLASEKITKTFHPKPPGFNAEKDGVMYELYRRNHQRQLSDKSLNILCIGDFSAFGEGYEYITPDRYGFIPYLQSILMHSDNFDNKPVRHKFTGSQKTGYAGDVGHEIYPSGKFYKDIARKAASSFEFQQAIGKVVPIMMGAKDMQLGRSVDDVLPEIHWLLSKIWAYDKSAVVLLLSVPMMGDPTDDGHEWWPVQRKIIEFNAQLAQIANYYATRDKRSIVYVHASAPPSLRIEHNPWIADSEGYHRIAYDVLSGLVQANERKFFDGDDWKADNIDETPGYELKPLKDKEVTNGIKCHQKRPETAPGYDAITKSLFRGAKDQDDWINNYACNTTFVCKFSWDTERYNTSAPFPFSEGKTCITAGGDNTTHATAHQFLVRRENFGDDLGDWCKDNLRDILDQCVKDGEGYGGYWGDGKRAIHLSNVKYHDGDATTPDSLSPVPNWRANFAPYEAAMSAIKSGPSSTFTPEPVPDDVESRKEEPTGVTAYSTFDAKATPPSAAAPEPPKGEPKSLQIVYEDYTTESEIGDTHAWHFHEGKQGEAVDACSQPLVDAETDVDTNAWDPPLPSGEWKLRFAGYAEDCTFKGHGERRADGDVGWLHCPERPAIKCLEDPRKAGGKDSWKRCDLGVERIVVAYCDWS
ncbi:hypothetical protein BDV95DRAFT_606418 [Massariosphaeria phaeospora]|uniref:SGNH hydrolase-type esterase domain-containing protein n=1 Tax=Massariosphaeria phaeospora TaxID=100035 RepID=A0A7C8IFN9_9PLEO|nr:hypothetical protein BDV95DRAFT_606418 [Massariosphaeria phaeospora]